MCVCVCMYIYIYPYTYILILLFHSSVPISKFVSWYAEYLCFTQRSAGRRCRLLISTVVLKLLLLLLFTTCMQAIYNYIADTKPVSTAYIYIYIYTYIYTYICTVAAVLYLQSVLHVMLFSSWNVFCTFTLEIPAVNVQCTIRLFSAVL